LELLIIFHASSTFPAIMQADACQLVLISQTEFDTQFQFTYEFTSRSCCPSNVFQLVAIRDNELYSWQFIERGCCSAPDKAAAVRSCLVSVVFSGMNRKLEVLHPVCAHK
jgi:hypothetical protein